MPRSTPRTHQSIAQIQALVSFLENDAQPSIVLDSNYIILAGNAAYRQQFGTDSRPFLGQKCFRISHGYEAPCDQSGEHCPMARARAQRAPDRVLHVHHTPRGPEHVDVEIVPIMDEAGMVIAFVERLNTVHHASPRAGSAQLVGRSPSFNKALSAVQRMAPSKLPVLLLGESGTGKELFAHAVHEASPRAQGPFVIVDCSGLPYDLFESELFGHEKGAFTGAHMRKMGLIETAHGGTLFLDEIGDVPLPLQVKLLRLLETGTFRSVGSVETRQADIRLVAATHLPLDAMAQDGRFRKDLFYRLNALPIRLPALRERREDIALLAEAFLHKSGGTSAQGGLSEAVLKRMLAYDWPGNVRELRNVIERARLFANGGTIQEEHLPDELLGASAQFTAPQEASPGPVHAHPISDDKLRMLAADRRISRKELAASLGISERTLYRRLQDGDTTTS